MRAAKAWYFCYFAALSTLFPFLNLFFLRLGLTTAQIGWIGCIRPLVSFPAGSLWSGAADKSRRHRAVMLGAFAAALALRLAVLSVGRHGFAPLLATVATMEACAAPITIITDAAVMAACTHQGDYGRQRLWGAVGWGLFAPVAGYLIRHAGVAAAFAAHAALMLVALGPTLRLPFGPLHAKLDEQLGDDLLEPKCSGPSGDLQLDEAAADGTAGAHGAAGGSKVAGRCDSALDAQRLLRHGRAGQPAAAGTLEDSGSGSGGGGSAPPAAQQWMRFWRGLRQLLGNPEAAIFLAQALFFGFGVGNIESFLFLYLDEMGGSELLMGLSLSVTCAAETLVFYFLPQLLRLGMRACMHLVFLAFLVRMACYAALRYAPSPWLVLPVEVGHGLTFALAWGGGSAYCAQLAPPGLEATTQGLFQGVYFGVGVGVGTLAGGHVFHRHGAQAVYLVACAVLAAGWLLTSAAQLALRLSGRRPGRDKYLQVPAVELGELQPAEGQA